MERYYRATEAVPAVMVRINAAVADAIRLLLEAKHIYQNVKVDAEAFVREYEEAIYGDDQEFYRQTTRAILEQADLDIGDRQLYSDGTKNKIPKLMVLLRGVKLVCSTCETNESFRPVVWNDMTAELRGENRPERLVGTVPQTSQLFAIVFECQRCTRQLQAVLIRRLNWQFFLDGRSPFEEIVLPPFLPKPEAGLFRDALIAAHGGKTLAALFYLRSFIEQFARRHTSASGRMTGEELMSAYNETLPEKQRDQMPSLRQWYVRISEALHAARADSDLFRDALDAISNHFEIRRAFRMPDKPADAAGRSGTSDAV